MQKRRVIFSILGVILGGVVLVGALYVSYLAASDTICLARTGVEPSANYVNDEVFVAAVTRIHERALTSLVRTLNPDTGFFWYVQHPDGTIGTTNNDIRQLLGSRVLALEAVTNEGVRPPHEQNLSTIFTKWYREEGEYGYVYAYEKSKLGANAMLLRVLVASPSFSSYERHAEKLVNGIVSLMNSDGSFEPWFKEPDYTYDSDYLLTFYSGEAILALLEYAEMSGDAQVLKEARRAQDFYIGEYVTRMEENYYPAYVPWHTLSLAKLFEVTGETKYVDAIFIMTDKLLEMQDTTEFIGRFYNDETPQYGTPHASSDAVYTEGLATAYAVAKKVGDAKRETRYREALARAVSNLESLQFKSRWYRFFDDKDVAERISGGIMTSVCDSRVRIDTTAHTLDALNVLEKALK